jgi:hypothetical protein
LRRIRVTTVEVEKRKGLYILSVFVALIIGMQIVCALLYFHLWSVRLYHIFPYCLLKGTTFLITSFYVKSVFWLLMQVLSVTFLIIKKIKEISSIYTCICVKCPLFFRFLWNLKFLEGFLKNNQMTMKFLSPTNAPLYYTHKILQCKYVKLISKM